VIHAGLRKGFVETSVKILEDYGLDGLDVDYEYPQNDEQAKGYVELLREMRLALDKHAEKKRARMQISPYNRCALRFGQVSNASHCGNGSFLGFLELDGL